MTFEIDIKSSITYRIMKDESGYEMMFDVPIEDFEMALDDLGYYMSDWVEEWIKKQLFNAWDNGKITDADKEKFIWTLTEILP